MGRFLDVSTDCARQMLDNAEYVRKELPGVNVPEDLRREITALCDKWTAAGTGAFEEMMVLLPLLDEPSPESAVLWEKIRRIHRTLRETMPATDAVVTTLNQAMASSPSAWLAFLLVSESAGNVLECMPELPTAVWQDDGEAGKVATAPSSPCGCSTPDGILKP